MKPTLEYEEKYWSEGKECICGVDEVGRGSWAGPLYVGAVVFDKNHKMIDGINDSKKLTPTKREKLHKEIVENSLAHSIGIVKHYEVDNYGLTLATEIAIERAIEGLGLEVDMLLVDAIPFKKRESESIIKGDAVCYSISCASILAKVGRDRYISNIPEAETYRFDKNKGYGTMEHVELIKKHGVSDVHRKSFKPIRILCG
ncbi:MAG: ribonuclease HII [Patescibacteria group bacterium]